MINNDFYHHLNEQWYTSQHDAIHLLRVEGETKHPWVLKQIDHHLATTQKRRDQIQLLDVGCGAGFLANFLAKQGITVTALDQSSSTLAVARQHDPTRSVTYIEGDALALPFAEPQFDVITCMDFLEHVDQPAKVIQQISRALKPGGLFLFHTFNRNWFSHLVIIRGMEWFLKGTPEHLHTIDLFIRPRELREWCESRGLSRPVFTGIGPKILTQSMLNLLFRKKVDSQFAFRIGGPLWLGYLGVCSKLVLNSSNEK